MSLVYKGVTFSKLTLNQVQKLDSYVSSMNMVDLAKIIDDAASSCLKYSVSATVVCVANATNVGAGFGIVIPANTIVRGFIIKSSAPYGAAGGAKTIQFSMGTVANADADLTDPTDVDIMIATGAIVATEGLHGDAANDHTAAYFPMDGFGKFFAADTTIYLNYIGQSAGATAVPGAVTSDINIWAIVEQVL